MNVFHCFISPHFIFIISPIQDVHEFAIPLILKIQRSTNSPPAPYPSAACREALYRLLLACVLVPHAKWPAPLHCAVRMFAAGRQDACIKVWISCFVFVFLGEI